MVSRNNISDQIGALKSGQSAYDSAQSPFLILVLVGEGASRDLVLAVKAALSAKSMGGEVMVAALDGYAGLTAQADACLILCGDDMELSAAAAMKYVCKRVPVALMADTSLAIPRLENDARLVTRICSAMPERAVKSLAHWLVYSCDKHLAIALNFEFCRDEEVKRITTECAAQNAAVGALGFLPGADLPVMCANQSKLALQIAAVYGLDLNLGRVGEIAGVVGAGFAWRALARQLLTFVPGIGWVVRAAVGYAGTVGTAWAIRAKVDPESSSRKLLSRAGEGFVSIKDRLFDKGGDEAVTDIGLSLNLGRKTS